MSRAVLLSVRPRFARSLLEGTKTIEVRRRFPQLDAGTVLYIYASSPERAVLGTLRVRSVERVPSSTVWEDHRNSIDIDRPALSSYLAGSAQAALVMVGEPLLWEQPVGLTQIRARLGIEPAQSYRYLDPSTEELLERLSFSTPVSVLETEQRSRPLSLRIAVA